MLGGQRIPRKKTVKYLGMHLDSNLKFSCHIDYLITRLSQYCGISYAIRKHLNLRAAKNYYFSCIYSSLSYCISVWGGALHTAARAREVSRLHERIVVNLFSKFYAGANSIFKAAGLLKLSDVHRLSAAVYMFKFERLGTCGVISSTVDREAPTHRYPTRHRDRLVPPPIRVEAMRVCFKSQFVSVWNGVPADILDNCRTVKTFKKALTQFFLDSY